ncbi:hypothetical protein FLO80_16520 [Aquicoccus porphyridii]|uniref:Uncharacterized protein n=1 Tax=Aquicoccus porphyridii TaxID=1852029 RepID=A0A5A9Z5I1_9RHOB|nr:hypothetical protein [Aquicoccus porphyridii]KAA0912215.1 hypothetical protein FLO80_16520 [Aquicoccus porphyridii]RAI52934.1 hypothetical protein DOO74_15750 [Rhodobacteraceae bacterium AsT-22]
MPDPSADLRYANTPSTPLADGEEVLLSFRADRQTYVRDHASMAAIAMAAGMVILWALGNPHVWTGAIGGLGAIALRGWYVASDELAVRWDLTDRRLLGPGTRMVGLREIKHINTFLSAVQIVTVTGDKHLIKYQSDAHATKARIERIAAGGRP